MANKKISELPAGGNFMNSNYFEGVEGGNNVRFTPDQVNPFRGTYAGGVAYPSSGGRYSGGAPAAGDQWVLTAELVVSGNVYSEGTILMSKVNNPGQTVSNWSAVTPTPDATESVKGKAQINNQAGAEDAASNGTVGTIDHTKILTARGWRYAWDKVKTLAQTISAKWTFNDVALTNQIQSGKKVGVYINTDGTLTKVSEAEYDSTAKKWTFTGVDSSSSSYVVEWVNSALNSILKLSNGLFAEFGGTSAFLEVPSGIASDNAGVRVRGNQSVAWKIMDSDNDVFFEIDSTTGAKRLVFKQVIRENQNVGFTTIIQHVGLITSTTASAQNTVASINVGTNQMLDFQITHMSAYATDGSVVKGYSQGVTKNASGTITGDDDTVTDLRLPNTLNGSWNIEHDNTNKRVNIRFQNESGSGKTYTCYCRVVYILRNLPT